MKMLAWNVIDYKMIKNTFWEGVKESPVDFDKL